MRNGSGLLCGAQLLHLLLSSPRLTLKNRHLFGSGQLV